MHEATRPPAEGPLARNPWVPPITVSGEPVQTPLRVATKLPVSGTQPTVRLDDLLGDWSEQIGAYFG